MRFREIAILASCVFLPASAHAQSIRRVNALLGTPVSNPNGLTWATAYTDLQQCLASLPGGPVDVWVAQGVYALDGQPGGGETFGIRAGVRVFGGFAGIETDRNQRDGAANPTILIGRIANFDGCGDAAAGSCFSSHSQPGCSYAMCCAVVCNVDPACCSLGWDGDCVAAAQILCDDGEFLLGDPPDAPACSGAGGSCYLVHAQAGCNEEYCCELVCFEDSACCEAGWDVGCVELALAMCITYVPFDTVDSVVSTAGSQLGDRLVDSCIITDGGPDPLGVWDSYKGGGVRVGDGTLNVAKCIVAGNRAYDGGGIALLSGESAFCAVWNSRLVRNQVAHTGGGFHGAAGYEIVNSEISDNHFLYTELQVDQTGGGVFDIQLLVDPEDPGPVRLIVNSTITHNVGSPEPGLGMYGSAAAQANLFVYNSIIKDNVGLDGELPCATAGELNCLGDVVGGAILEYSNVYMTDRALPATCIDRTPEFFDWGGGDYRLLPTSPCINAGLDLYVEMLEDPFDVDQDGSILDLAPDAKGGARVLSGSRAPCARVDMGAYEHDGEPCIVGDLNGDELVDGADLGLLLANWGGTGLGDLDCTLAVDGADLGELLANWGVQCEGIGAALAATEGGQGEQNSVESLAEALGFESTVGFIAWVTALPDEEIFAWMQLLSE